MALGFDFTPLAVGPGRQAVSGLRRNVLHDESSRRAHVGDARRKARFPAVLSSRCERFQLRANCFFGGIFGDAYRIEWA
ncbi:hypothetical protein NDK50_19165 [Paraburkholderia bryophila]|uniref:hypothetical protein n=1 Tax=Paraburkholderia bryophila TaxID=420952 RepID=UPI00234A6751|nr:hypothetical protein [Paraburkholderia bryophila]WCM19511.1 hypothetical protein NDK50_19165 [Paraburkholderia bryophila]